jgi:hypothetical protein
MEHHAKTMKAKTAADAGIRTVAAQSASNEIS